MHQNKAAYYGMIINDRINAMFHSWNKYWPFFVSSILKLLICLQTQGQLELVTCKEIIQPLFRFGKACTWDSDKILYSCIPLCWYLLKSRACLTCDVTKTKSLSNLIRCVILTQVFLNQFQAKTTLLLMLVTFVICGLHLAQA